jgi:hypothetical protein
MSPRAAACWLGAAAATVLAAGAAGCGGEEDARTATAPPAVPALTTAPSPTIARACRRARARTTARTVACPPVVPVGRTVVELPPGPYDDAAPDSYLLAFRSPALGRPPSSPARSAGGRWTVTAGPPALVDRIVGAHRSTDGFTPRHAPARRTTIAGVPALEYRMARSPLGGYFHGDVVLAWRDAGVGYLVSARDPRNAPRARAIAAGLVRRMRER